MMKNKIFLFLCFAITEIFSFGQNIEQFLKPALGKGINHHIKNIDFIYIINLDQRPEKFKSCIDQLSLYDIQPYRFSAVCGWLLSFDTINQLGVILTYPINLSLMGTYYNKNLEPIHEKIRQVGRSYFSHCLSRGALGIVLSHLSVLQDAYDSGYETIWVMEDDIDIIQNPHLLSQRIEELDACVGKNRWDILFTDRDTKNQQGKYVPCKAYAKRFNYSPQRPKFCLIDRSVNQEFRQIGARYGAYSMIIRRSGMKKILDFFKTYNIFLPYDMEFPMINNIHMYTVKKDIVSTQIKALSDNGSPPPALNH
jgi:GR25 family glycosyltransferase involved in LPS biosynthesis